MRNDTDKLATVLETVNAHIARMRTAASSTMLLPEKEVRVELDLLTAAIGRVLHEPSRPALVG